MRAGQRSYIPGAGYIRVTAVNEVQLADLTDADARPDGFETAAALRAEIALLYPAQLAAGHRAYRIVFELVPRGEKRGWKEGLGMKAAGASIAVSHERALWIAMTMDPTLQPAAGDAAPGPNRGKSRSSSP